MQSAKTLIFTGTGGQTIGKIKFQLTFSWHHDKIYGPTFLLDSHGIWQLFVGEIGQSFHCCQRPFSGCWHWQRWSCSTPSHCCFHKQWSSWCVVVDFLNASPDPYAGSQFVSEFIIDWMLELN